jgi:predicted RNase H-like HicB family nuclease
MDYRVRVRQAGNGEWVASAEGMPGCTVKGQSREAVLDEMRKAINMYVAGLLEEGIDEPEDGDQGEVVTLSL